MDEDSDLDEKLMREAEQFFMSGKGGKMDKGLVDKEFIFWGPV